MSWKLHTPEGSPDLLVHESLQKENVILAANSVFKSFGYHSVHTPTMEFYDVFSSGAAKINQQTMFKFFDEEGRIIVLRPDITTPIARLFATKMKDAVLPVRICYTGSAFRNERGLNGDKQREFTQCGIELLGESSPLADAEVIAVTIETLIKSGLKNFQIDIGQVEFFKGLAQQIGLNNDETEKLRELVDVKNSLAIKNLVANFNVNENVKKITSSLPSLFGGVEILDKIASSDLNERSQNAIENLKEIYSILKDYEMEKYISIDLGMVQSLNYYTGMIFKGFVNELGYPVCAGGRYDNLTAEFGKNEKATGVAIGIDRLLSALFRQGKKPISNPDDILIYFPSNLRKKAYIIASEYRKENKTVVTYMGENKDNAILLAKQKNIKTVVFVGEKETVQINVLNEEELS